MLSKFCGFNVRERSDEETAKACLAPAEEKTSSKYFSVSSALVQNNNFVRLSVRYVKGS